MPRLLHHISVRYHLWMLAYNFWVAMDALSRLIV